MPQSTKGAFAAATAFTMWGILPLYWKQLNHVPADEINCHRVIWTFFLMLIYLAFTRRMPKLFDAISNRKLLTVHIIAAICLCSNWLVYVWATLNERIVEAALGYYINPFLYILLGKIFLGEKHGRLQIIAICVAAAGVLLQLRATEHFPWLALFLACTFAVYGMLRKKSPLGPVTGLCLETGIMLPFAVAWLIHIHVNSGGSFGGSISDTYLLAGAGIATAAPLLLFAYGAKNISLSLLGILQFIGPTGKLLLGWLYYNEPMPLMRILSFSFIWAAMILYIIALKKPPEKEN